MTTKVIRPIEFGDGDFLSRLVYIDICCIIHSFGRGAKERFWLFALSPSEIALKLPDLLRRLVDPFLSFIFYPTDLNSGRWEPLFYALYKKYSLVHAPSRHA